MRRGAGREAPEPSAHLERALIPAHPDAQRRRGGCLRSPFKFTIMDSKSPTKAPRLTHLGVPVCWRRSCRLGADGGRRPWVQVERRGSAEPSSSLLLALTDPLQRREERRMKPYSFLFFSMTRQRRNSSPSPPSLAMPSRALRKRRHRVSLRSRRRVTRFATRVREAPTAGPRTSHLFHPTQRFPFTLITVFTLKR